MSNWEIKRETLNQRCEICHQNDCFDAVNNICSRCTPVVKNNKTPSQLLTKQPAFMPTRFNSLFEQSVSTPNLIDRLINTITRVPKEAINYWTALNEQGLNRIFHLMLEDIRAANYHRCFFMGLLVVVTSIKFLFWILSALFGLGIIPSMVAAIIGVPNLFSFLVFMETAFVIIIYISNRLSHYCWQYILAHD